MGYKHGRTFVGSVANFDFRGKIRKPSIRNSMTYRLQDSRKSNFATEPARLTDVWSAERRVSPRGGEVRRARRPASPRDLTGVSRGAQAAQADGPAADAWAVDTWADRHHRRDWTRHQPGPCRRRAGAGSAGPVAGPPRGAPPRGERQGFNGAGSAGAGLGAHAGPGPR